MKKPIFNPEINWGHLLMAVSFLVPAVLYGFSVAADMKVVKRELERHENIIVKLSELQTLGMQNQAVLVQRFSDHLETTRERTRSPRDAASNP